MVSPRVREFERMSAPNAPRGNGSLSARLTFPQPARKSTRPLSRIAFFPQLDVDRFDAAIRMTTAQEH
jgi:hypothetical protein